MRFAAIIEYAQDPELVARVRPIHREYLAGLRARGQLAAAGPFTDGSGALIIYEAATVEDADHLIKEDPFYRQGIFLKFQLRPWNPVMADLQIG
jgi:uncharacterized protein YciI